MAIPRSTLATWVSARGVRLQPPADAFKHHVSTCSTTLHHALTLLTRDVGNYAETQVSLGNP
jgi:hypothetical protein